MIERSEEHQNTEFEPDPEWVNKCVQMAKKSLEQRFVGEPLTDIEVGWLRRTIIEVFKTNHSLSKQAYGETAMEPAVEAVDRFLIHYGLNKYNFPSKHGDSFMYIEDPITLDYVKNYLRKAREEAHKPYLD